MSAVEEIRSDVGEPFQFGLVRCGLVQRVGALVGVCVSWTSGLWSLQPFAPNSGLLFFIADRLQCGFNVTPGEEDL